MQGWTREGAERWEGASGPGEAGCVRCHNYIMLRALTRALQFGAYSLKHFRYSRASEMEWLRQRFYGNPLYASKLEYLSKLEGEAGLRNFFQNKSIDLLSEEEIYYLFHSDMDYHISRDVIRELMAKIQSPYFMCLLAKEFRWADDVEQCLILIRLNEHIPHLPPHELVLCLEVVSEFPPAPLEDLDKQRLLKRLAELQRANDHYHLILATGYLLEMGIVASEVVRAESVEVWLRENRNFDFRAIYFLHKVAERAGVALREGELAALRRHMKQAIHKLQISYFENNYLVFLLQYYPEYVKTLSLLHFTPRAYIGYLRFYLQNPSHRIDEHRVPASVVELTDLPAFRTVIDLRLNLGLDSPLSLAKALPTYFAHSLKAVNSFLAYLRDNKIADTEIEYYVERAVSQQLKLQQEFSVELAEQFAVGELLELLDNLSRDGLGSVDFWKRAVRMLERMVELSQQAPIITPNFEDYVHLLAIITTKNFSERTRDLVYKQLIDLLTTQDWPMKLIVRATKIMAAKKIGEDEIWLLLERKALKFLSNQKDSVMGDSFRDNLVKLILSFNSVEKGTYKFWSKVNDTLDVKTKKDILNRIKQHNSLAHAHLVTNY